MSGLIQTVKAAFSSSDLEVPPYTVLNTSEGYEERQYLAQKWVKTEIKGMSKDKTQSVSFWKLFNYISGQNDKEIKIPMTAPVTTLIEPGDSNCESTFTMAFYIPPAFQNETPLPTDPAVSIEERAKFKVFVRTYGGFSNDNLSNQEYHNLLIALSDEDQQRVDTSEIYYDAGYDPPFKLLSRHNEIWIRIKDDDEI